MKYRITYTVAIEPEVAPGYREAGRATRLTVLSHPVSAGPVDEAAALVEAAVIAARDAVVEESLERQAAAARSRDGRPVTVAADVIAGMMLGLSLAQKAAAMARLKESDPLLYLAVGDALRRAAREARRDR